MIAILRRELSAYFYSPIGYVCLAAFYVFAGLFFTSYNLVYGVADISYVFSSMFTIVLFLIPILTMRLFSEDKKNRTEQALLTAPISLPGLVFGKFLAALLVFVMSLSITIVFGLIVNAFTAPNWQLIWGNFIAMLLLGMAMISIGTLISSLTENQVIAAIGGFVVSLALMVIDMLASAIMNPIVTTVLQSISFNRHYMSFSQGIFNLADIFFFVAVTVIFLFLTVRVLEKRRWS